jgi:hypothetical protein
MLRFTLHRPSQNSAVSTCCHAMSCRDVSGRVHVGVRPVPASHTYEGRLALATLRCDVLAGMAGLRRVRSFHFFDPAGSLLLQSGHEQTPPGFEDAPVEAGLLCDVPGFCTVPAAERVMPLMLRFSRRITSNLRARSVLVFWAQSLRRSPSLDLKAPIRILTLRRRFDPRAARASLACNRRSRSASLARKPLGAGHLTSGQCHRERDTPVHADDAADPGCGDRFGDHSERDMPTARPLTCDAARLPVHEGAAAFELYPADLRPPAHWTVPGCRGGPEQPAARRSANPHPDRLYATSGADGSRRRSSATPGQGHATPAAERSATPQASHRAAAQASVSCAAWALNPGVGPFQRRHIRVAPGRGSTRTGRGRTARPGALPVRRSDTDGTSWHAT